MEATFNFADGNVSADLPSAVIANTTQSHPQHLLYFPLKSPHFPHKD
ncbi:hypothetical protein [Phocaeicola sp.]